VQKVTIVQNALDGRTTAEAVATQLAARIEEKTIGFIAGKMVEEGLALTHDVVLKDLPNTSGVAQEHFALLAVERLMPILLEEQHTVVSRAAQRGNAGIAMFASEVRNGRN